MYVNNALAAEAAPEKPSSMPMFLVLGGVIAVWALWLNKKPKRARR